MVTHGNQPGSPTFADIDLETRVRAALARRLGPTCSQLSIEARSGCVTLRGKVFSYYEKQLGSASASRVAGVYGLVDAVEVVPTPRFRQRAE